MQKVEIGFAGEGWGAVSAVKGLQKSFFLQCLTEDKNVNNELTQDSRLITNFNQFDCDIIVCAGYRPIISKQLVTKYKILNIHYSLLPAYRGLHSTAWAIMNGEKKLGLTIYRMNEYIDDGPILHQKEFINDQTSSATSYMNLMNSSIEENLADIINKYIQGLLVPKKQDRNKASWVGKRGNAHNLIDFNKGFESCKRLFRVLQDPYPRPKIKYGNNTYTVEKVAFHPSTVDTDKSRILNIDNNGVWVSSKEGYIILNDMKDINGLKVNNNIFKIGRFVKA